MELTVSGSPAPWLRVGRAFATRTSPNFQSEECSLVVELTNIGSEPYCQIQLGPITLRSADGTALAMLTSPNTRVTGSNFDAGTSCLGAGESGYWLGGSNLYGTLATVSFQPASAQASPALFQPAARLIPVGYVSSGSNVSVSVVNQGSATARLFSGEYVLLDASGAPIGSSSLGSPGLSGEVVAPQATALINGSVWFYGTVTSMKVFTGSFGGFQKRGDGPLCELE